MTITQSAVISLILDEQGIPETEVVGGCPPRSGRCFKMEWVFLPNSTND